ncbi:MAG TPA: hypothetical protein VL463_03075 [Kofleriaceae bacterium]|jgi:hypothetical protein|nr:hypothetical protein [Kofleriaceae bacterium]
MARSRLYRSIVVFGTAIGAGAPIVAASLAPACELYEGPHKSPPPDAWHNTISDAANPPDAWHGIIDAQLPDAWPTIADAPNPDAGTKS